MSFLRQPSLIATGLVVLFALGAAQRPEFLESLERWSYDRRFRLRGPGEAQGEVVVIGLDDATNARAPELFTRRAGIARLLKSLREAEAGVIGFDLLLSKPEDLLGPDLAAEIEALLKTEGEQDTPTWKLLRKISEVLSGDQTLEATMKEKRDVILALSLGQRGGPEVDPRTLRRATYGQFTPGAEGFPDLPRALTSLPRFARAAAGMGTINIYEDRDKIVRSLTVASFHQGRAYAPLSLLLVARHAGYGRGELAFIGDPLGISWGEKSLELESGRQALLNFRGREAHPYYSAIDVVEGKVPAGALKGKMVLVGITYFGHDAINTPLDARLPGVFVHAEAIDNFLVGDFHHRAPALLDAGLTLGLGLLVVLLFLPALKASPGLRSAGTALVLLAHLGVAWFLFSGPGYWIALVAPGLAAGSAAATGLLLGWLREGRQRRQLRHTFAHYLSPAVIEELIHNPDALQPGGARRELTVLFSDIRSFTTLSENHSPEEVVAFLGRYLDPMTRAVLEAGGLLDKYIGDALMAVFGAPVPTETHPRAALEATLTMHAALEVVRRGERGGFAELEIGVGMNTGEMVVGNMGSHTRFDYTVVGDAVNLASRLESLTKAYGVFCLCGEATRAAAPEGFLFREVDRVRVKGKDQPVSIHEFLGGPGRTVASYDELPTFEVAIEAWRGGRLAEARQGFESFAAANPADPVAPLFLERLEQLGDTPPPGWDGVFTFAEK